MNERFKSSNLTLRAWAAAQAHQGTCMDHGTWHMARGSHWGWYHGLHEGSCCPVLLSSKVLPSLSFRQWHTSPLLQGERQSSALVSCLCLIHLESCPLLSPCLSVQDVLEIVKASSKSPVQAMERLPVTSSTASLTLSRSLSAVQLFS